MPGAKPKGSLAPKAMTKVPTIDASAVAVKAAPMGIPSRFPNMAGLTAKIYDIVKKVVIPATISTRTDVSFELNPNNFVNINIIIKSVAITTTQHTHPKDNFIWF